MGGAVLGADRTCHRLLYMYVLAVVSGTERPGKPQGSVLSLRLPDGLKNCLDHLSAQTGRPVSFYVREALTEHLDHLEDVYALAARAEAVRSGQARTFSLSGVAHELGITLSPVSGADPEDIQ